MSERVALTARDHGRARVAALESTGPVEPPQSPGPVRNNRAGSAHPEVVPLPTPALRRNVATPRSPRGYGQSSKPPTTPDHAPYSKRAIAADMTVLMRHLEHERFVVVGHDRGSYVAFRLALDHPAAVLKLAVLDSVPIADALARCTDRFATAWWHWFFFAQPDKPERAINADPDAWYGGAADAVGAQAYAEYRTAIHDPATVHAMLEDYRAGLGIDRAHDEADRAADRQLTSPVLVLWSTRDDLESLYGNPLDYLGRLGP